MKRLNDIQWGFVIVGDSCFETKTLKNFYRRIGEQLLVIYHQNSWSCLLASRGTRILAQHCRAITFCLFRSRNETRLFSRHVVLCQSEGCTSLPRVLLISKYSKGK